MADIKEYPVCRRCGRKLKDGEARIHGMGMTCYQKYLKEINNKKGKLFDAKSGTRI